MQVEIRTPNLIYFYFKEDKGCANLQGTCCPLNECHHSSARVCSGIRFTTGDIYIYIYIYIYSARHFYEAAVIKNSRPLDIFGIRTIKYGALKFLMAWHFEEGCFVILLTSVQFSFYWGFCCCFYHGTMILCHMETGMFLFPQTP